MFDFNDLFILDMANNHQGDLKHGLNIIKQMGKTAQSAGVRTALKFQFRQIDTFIHPDFQDRDDLKHIPRFMSTRLSNDDYKVMVKAVKDAGMISVCTPFDEESVDVIMDLNIDVIKIASCSCMDRPLLNKIAQVNKPVILSTAGMTLSQLDKVVSFFEHKNVNFAIMHCVAVYPAPAESLSLNNIAIIKSRYPSVPVGWSTHEDPNNIDAVKVAYALGARIFERHVGVQTDEYKLNGYSSTPEQVNIWMTSLKTATSMCGSSHRAPTSPEELESLQSLMRGVYASKSIKKGQTIPRESVFFAMPAQDKQLTTNNWSDTLVADKDYKAKEAIAATIADITTTKDELVQRIILQTKAMLNDAKIFFGKESSIEISHHYGLERFREFGATIVDCINREYCKKLIILLPRQKHPYHFHKKKEETFQLLYGDMEVELDGQPIKLEIGDTLVVEKDAWHKFHTLDGAIFEEVSTTHYNDDSFYEDKAIALLSREERKTQVANWEAIEQDTM